LIDTVKILIIVAKITEKLNKQCYIDPSENEKCNVRKICDVEPRGKLL
jgi:hypothetical protein